MTGRIHLLPAVLGAAVILGALLVRSPAAAPAEAAAGFEVYHFGSHVEGRAFREVFLVHQVDPGFAVPHGVVEVRRNGEPLAVSWEAAGPQVAVGDTFSFVEEAFDEKLVLTAHVAGAQVMACAFGGGAGVSIHPDEWRAMGLGHEVRCLGDLSSDIDPDGLDGHEGHH
jgi:hypothetical protein